MTSQKFHLHNGKKGAALAIRVTPRSSHYEIAEILGDGTVRARLTAHPVEGIANDALLEFLAGVLGIAPSKLEVVAGLNGKDKLVSVLDLDADMVHERILAHIK